METRNTLAVVDDTHFYTVGKKWEHTASTLAGLLEQAEQFRLSHVWIVSKTRLSTVCGMTGQPGGWSIREMRTRKKLAYCSAIRENSTLDKRIQIAVVENTPWPWTGCESPKTLIATLAYLEDTLKLPIEWTPGHMAIEVLRQKNAIRWSWLAPMTTNLEQHGFEYGIVSGEITDWHSSLPQDGEYELKIDSNSDYGAGMTGLNVGEGNPRWVSGSDVVNAAYDKKRPGLWSVEILDHGMWDGKQLPSFQDYTWMSTDMIEELRNQGLKIVLSKGWYWPVYHQTLRSTVSNKERTGLWDLRLVWRGCKQKSLAHKNMYESISAILHTVHGKLGDEDIFDKRFYRPDIYELVVAKAVARRAYRIMKIFREFGLLPKRVHIDSPTYVVNDPHILDAILNADKLGAFKHVKTVAIER